MSLPKMIQTLMIYDLESFLKGKMVELKNGKSSVGSSITFHKRFSIYQRDFFRCAECKLEATHVVSYIKDGVRIYVLAAQKSGGFEGFTIDHIIPRSLGGWNTYSNLQTMCEYCNSLKGDTLPDGVITGYEHTDCNKCLSERMSDPFSADSKCIEHGGVPHMGYGRFAYREAS